MSPENFTSLYEAMKERYPSFNFQYDGEGTISHELSIFGISGIWVNIINVSDADDDNDFSYSVCYDLRNANGQLCDRHLGDLEQGKADVIQCLQEAFICPRIFDVIKDKAFISNPSGAIAEVVERIPEDGEEGKAFFDGMVLLDCIKGVGEGLDEVTAITKDGEKINLEDYYSENGAFEDDGNLDSLIDSLDNLMTREEYAKASKTAISKATDEYIKQRDEEIKKAVRQLQENILKI